MLNLNIYSYRAVPPYGRYGGPGRSGEKVNPDGSIFYDARGETVPYYEDPYDALDVLFKIHDLMYDKAKKPLCFLLADAVLVANMMKLDSTKLSPEGVAYREMATAYFGLKVATYLPGALANLGGSSVASQASDSYTDACQWVQPWRDPLTLDLDDDGIETVAASLTNPILFDHDGDGIKNGTGWISGMMVFWFWTTTATGSLTTAPNFSAMPPI
ncbi:MAG: hypothetical protein HGA96_16430 [Desulfobulbaceae bacterium]|nr:hypothetical protein [Desulfobulbaceae bacterium]